MTSPFPGSVILWCEAEVAGEKVSVRQVADRDLIASDLDYRHHIEQALRFRLVEEILKKWTPVVHYRSS